MEDNRKTWLWLNIALLAATWLVSIYAYGNLPQRIPVHFTWDGMPDNWSDKTYYTYFFLPLLGTIIVIGMLVLTKFPEIYNFPQKEQIKTWPAEKKKPIHAILSKMMLVIALLVNLLFFFIQFMIIEGAKKQQVEKSQFWIIMGLSIAFLPVVLYYLVRVGKTIEELKKGMRT